MLKSFEKHIIENFQFLKNAKLLIAISGGLDSIVLTYLCHSLKLDISLVHCNFNLRDKESDDDEQFVIDLANSLNLEVFIQNFDTDAYAKSHKLSTQMAARKLRYDWFNELAEQLQFDYILTAHHADDSLETFLINLSRGTGLDGLTGIPTQNGKIIRPLLSFSRNDIATYAKENKLDWREDSSNATDKYLRNALRHQVVPKLKELNPQLLENFQKTKAHLEDAKLIISDRVNAVKDVIMSRKENGDLSLDVFQLKKLSNPKVYLYHMLKDYGFTEWNDVEDLLNAQSGKQVLSSNWRLINNRDCLILSELNKRISQETQINKLLKKVKINEDAVLLFDEADALFGKRTDIKAASDRSENEIFIDKDLLEFPLIVRAWEKGDYFYPFGMNGKKKLSKFFKDEKLSLLEKERIQLLCSADKIIWVIGKRFDNRFKVTDKTKNILKISFKK